MTVAAGVHRGFSPMKQENRPGPIPASLLAGALLLFPSAAAQGLSQARRAAWKRAVEANVSWFLHSGILLAPDGSRGVAERFILPGKIAAHRRPDCNLETALALRLAGRYLERQDVQAVSRRILQWLEGANLQDRNPLSPTFGLLTWSDKHPGSYWVDDNSWNAAIPLLLERFGGADPKLLHLGLQALLALEEGAPARGKERDSPHWPYLQALPFGLSARLAGDKTGRSLAAGLMERALARLRGKKKPPYTTSECGYLLLEASMAAAAGSKAAKEVVRRMGDYLVRVQLPGGGWPGEWREGSRGREILDLVYTQNWCTLGMLHAWRLTGDERYRDSLRRSLDLLAAIQDKGPDPRTRGCWRGGYDLKNRSWGGKNEIEGGPSSVYSGWTNAPILLCFLLELTGTSFFDLPPDVKKLRTRLAALLARERSARRKARIQALQEAAAKARAKGILSFAAKVTLFPAPDPPYGENRIPLLPSKLTDGTRTLRTWAERKGLGWRHEKIVEVTLDLGRKEEISEVRVHLIGGGNGGCAFPASIEVLVPGAEKPAARLETFPKGKGLLLHEARLPLPAPLQASRITLRFRPRGEWLMVDEITLFQKKH